jgi:hypothetical protein
MQIHQFVGGKLLAMFLHQLLNVVLIHLQSHGLPQGHNFMDNWQLLFMIRPQFSPSRIEGSLGDPIPRFIDDLEAVYDVEMIFPKLGG